MQERRALARHQVDFNGKLIFVDASSVLDCTVGNMTEDGARIGLPREVEVPKRVYLWERQTNMVFECEVRWRDRDRIGVRFLDTCGRLMRQAIVEACSHHVEPPVLRKPAVSTRRRRTAARS